MRLAVQPRDIGARILPAHAHDWITVSLRMAGIVPSQLRILLPFEDGAAAAATITGRVSRLPSEYRVLAASDVVLAQRERRQRNRMLGRFVGDRSESAAVACCPCLFEFGGAHHEMVRRNDDHFGTIRAFSEDSTRLRRRSLLCRWC